MNELMQCEYVKSSSCYPGYQMSCKVLQNININTLSDEMVLAIRQQIPKSGVLLIRNQQLSKDDLVHWTERLGQPIELPDGLRFNNFHEEYPSLTRISNLKPDGTLIQAFKGAEYWHSDGDFWQAPHNYVISSLYAETVPSVGGETGFADLRLAYECLPSQLKDQVDALTVWVSPQHIPDFDGAKQEELPPDAYHKIAYEHLETGRTSLYFGCMSAEIKDMPQHESRQLLCELMTFIEQPKHLYAHKWQVGDLLLWDNTSTMHRSLGGYGNSHRLMYRSQVFAAT